MTVAAGRLRVVLVIAQLGLGGTERQVALLAGALRDRGHDVVVVLLFHGGPHADVLRAAGVDVRGPLARPGPAAPLLAFVRLVALLRRVRPDVVHAFLLAACALTALAAVLTRVPVRVAGRRSLGDWKDGRGAVVALERLTNPAYHAFVANAEAVAADAMRRERIPADRMHVIPNALPFPTRRRTAPAPADALHELPQPVVLCVANLIAYKGHRHLLEAQRLLRDDGTVFGLALAGDGPERSALTDMAIRHELPVSFLGARSDVPELLRQVDVVVLPSMHEGMSNALMEALGEGCAIVATDVGGNREVLGDAGVLCAAADPVALAAALRTLLGDPARRSALGRRASERAAQLFGEQRLADEHVALYRRLLGASTGSR